MLRLQILCVLVFVLAAFGVAYLQGDDVNDHYVIPCYTCDKTNEKTSSCKAGVTVHCKYCLKENENNRWTAKIKKDGPKVGTCKKAKDKDSNCDRTIPCESYCGLCRRDNTTTEPPQGTWLWTSNQCW